MTESDAYHLMERAVRHMRPSCTASTVDVMRWCRRRHGRHAKWVDAVGMMSRHPDWAFAVALARLEGAANE